MFCKVYSSLLKSFVHKNTRTLKCTIFDFLIALYLFCKVYSNLLKSFVDKNTGTLKCTIFDF